MIQSLLQYTEQSTYLKLFFVGLFNTLLVSSLGIFLATLIGFSIGIMRLTRHPIMSRLASVFVEIIRNIPLLLQILVWYFLLLEVLPSPRSSLEWMQSVFLNNRGLYFPFPVITTTGLGLSWPVLEGFNFVGGICLIPELCALLLALSLYTAAFISEIVRAGIQGVQTGQIELQSHRFELISSNALCDSAAKLSNCDPPDKSVLEPHKKLISGSRDRLSRFGGCICWNSFESNRAGN